MALTAFLRKYSQLNFVAITVATCCNPNMKCNSDGNKYRGAVVVPGEGGDREHQRTPVPSRLDSPLSQQGDSDMSQQGDISRCPEFQYFVLVSPLS